MLTQDEDVEWYEKNYPHSSFSWLFTLLLSEFRAVSEEGKTPRDLAKLGAMELKREIDGHV